MWSWHFFFFVLSEGRHLQDTENRLRGNMNEQKHLNDATVLAELDKKAKHIDQKLMVSWTNLGITGVMGTWSYVSLMSCGVTMSVSDATLPSPVAVVCYLFCCAVVRHKYLLTLLCHVIRQYSNWRDVLKASCRETVMKNRSAVALHSFFALRVHYSMCVFCLLLTLFKSIGRKIET